MRFFLPQRKELYCGSSPCAEGSGRVSAAASTDAHCGSSALLGTAQASQRVA